MIKRILPFCLTVMLIQPPAFLCAEGEEFVPVTRESLDEFYSREERSAGVNVTTEEILHEISPAFLGVNMSYFISTDEMWNEFDFNDKLRRAGVGSLRYPGGHETGFFHWENPGVNGYEDLWAPEEEHGNPPYRGRFQTTWMPPSEWDTNESFMNFDEFMAVCRETGAEPVVGINLSSGRKYDRRQDGIDEALRWLRYCVEMNYDVTYWFLECEPWHSQNNYTFNEAEYTEEVLAYGRAIKSEYPDVKLIINPSGQGGYRYTDWYSGLIRDTKEVIDFVDIHWYWAWGRGSFEHWLEHTPVGLHSMGDDHQMGYADGVEYMRKACEAADAADVGVVVLEWNIAPSDQSQTFSESLSALIHGEILMEYLRADVELTCLWPLLWSSSRDVWSEQDFFPSLVTLDPPYKPTRSLDLFRLLSPVQGAGFVQSTSDRPDQSVAACVRDDKLYLYCLSKNVLRRRVTIRLDRDIAGIGAGEYIALKNQVTLPLEAEQADARTIRIHTEPYSFNAVVLDLAPARE